MDGYSQIIMANQTLATGHYEKGPPDVPAAYWLFNCNKSDRYGERAMDISDGFGKRYGWKLACDNKYYSCEEIVALGIHGLQVGEMSANVPDLIRWRFTNSSISFNEIKNINEVEH